MGQAADAAEDGLIEWESEDQDGHGIWLISDKWWFDHERLRQASAYFFFPRYLRFRSFSSGYSVDSIFI